MAQLSVELAKTVISTGVKTTYGDPVVIDDVTLIPVASQYFGFGAGEGNAGEGSKESMAGSGGGGGGVSMPFGAYVKRGEDFRFEPNPITFMIVAVPFVVVAAKGLARVIRALKR